MKNIKIPGIRFFQSSIPLEFNTDGIVQTIMPAGEKNDPLDSLFILSDLHYEFFNFKKIPAIKCYDTISLPDDFSFPEIFDGTQNLAGKKILLFMLTGWGDTILIEPVIRAFYKKISTVGKAPEITIAGNWIKNFPYHQVPYIHDLRPNILSMNDLRHFDILVNFIPAHLQRSARKSLQDLFGEVLHVFIAKDGEKMPFISASPDRIARIKPVLDEIRTSSGKKLLYVNWLARFAHKNADLKLLSEVLTKLTGYQAITANDKPSSAIIDKDIEKYKTPIINLSGFIEDFHDTIAGLSLVDAFISVDTGIVHAAGALKIPGVALFGPFPPETHVACYPSVIGLRTNYSGSNCQGPCLETHLGCKETGYRHEIVSPCFQDFSPEDILKAFKEALHTKP